MTVSPNPFDIEAGEIAQLDTLRLVQLLNALLRNEAVNLGLPANKIKLTEAISTPDGGIDLMLDARQIAPGQTGHSTYLDPGLTVVQYKKSWTSGTKVKKELQKPEVQEAFTGGANYLLIVGASMTAPQQAKRENDLKGWATAANCTGGVRLYVAEHLAGWSSEVPASRAAFRSALRDYLQASQFLEREQRHQVPFRPDASRQALIDEVIVRMFGKAPVTSHIRISGAAGVGKSRLALEIVRAAGLAELSLYSPNFPTSRELFTWVAGNPTIRTTLVIDECDDEQALELEQWARQCDGRLRLITVGVGQGTGQEVIRLSPLDQATMQAVVRVAAPTLPDEQVKWTAENTGGYVKLAILVAQYIAAGHKDIVPLRTDREIARFISTVIAPDPERRHALHGVAVLTSVGWLEEVRVEGEVIAKFLGISWERMQSLLQPLIRDGIVVPRGRYWYVSPELLAIWLATEVWESQAHRIFDLLDALPSLSARERLIKRVSQLGDVAGVREVLEEMLGASGPFRDLQSLNNRNTSRLFSSLASGVPATGLNALDRIIGMASRDDLLRFVEGRQDIVWLLERLLERRETFWTAARLIRRLAETENAKWANNATGVWQSIFLTMLGATEVPAMERLGLIDEALDSDSVEVRLLGVTGLASALQTREIGLGRGAHGATVPPEYWSPTVWGEVWEVKRAALARLDRAMHDSSPEVCRTARSLILDNAHDLVATNMGDDVVQRLIQLEGDDEAERRKIWETVNYAIRHNEARLPGRRKFQLQQALLGLYGDSLLGRIKRYTGLPTYQQELFCDDEGFSIEQSLRELAVDSLNSPNELRAALPWLVSGEASNAFVFGKFLGELDSSRECLELLSDAVKDGKNAEVLSGYLSGRAGAEHSEWREELLDGWSQVPEMALAVLDATMRNSRSDHAVGRLLRMIDEGLLDIRVLGWLQYGSWANVISERTLVDVLSRLLNDGTSRSIAVGLALCSDRFDQAQPTSDVIEYAWRLLSHTSAWESEPMLSLYWTQIARKLAATDPIRVAQLVVDSYIEGEASLGDRRIDVLNEIVTVAPDKVWTLVGKALLGQQRAYRLSWVLEEDGFVIRVPAKVVSDWIRVIGGRGAEVVASIIRLEQKELPELVRLLLVEYGDEVEGILAANFRSGSWSGDESFYLEGKLAIARTWALDHEPNVKIWANKVVGWLEGELNKARIRDEEWGLS